MAKVYKQKARADIYCNGLRTKSEKNKSGWSIDYSKPADENDVVVVKKGQEYFTWTLYGRAPQISIDYPKRQQLTGSDFLCQVYDLEDRISELECEDIDSLKSEIDEIISDINSLADEQDEKRNNMPESLQDAPTGELLQNRYDSLQEWASNLEGVSIDFDEPDKEEDEDGETFERRKEDELTERIQELKEGLVGYTYEGE